MPGNVPGNMGVNSLGGAAAQAEHTTSSLCSVSDERKTVSGERAGRVGTAVNPPSAHDTVPPTQEVSRDVQTGGGSKAISAELPTLPPFFKGGQTCNVEATGSTSTQGATDEPQTSQLLEAAQIQGVGNAGEFVTKQHGCKCVVM